MLIMTLYHFFLGGQDAEMVEIKQIIKKHNLPVADNALPWGAKLTMYKDKLDELTNEVIPVFIELIIDCSYPERSIIVY